MSDFVALELQVRWFCFFFVVRNFQLKCNKFRSACDIYIRILLCMQNRKIHCAYLLQELSLTCLFNVHFCCLHCALCWISWILRKCKFRLINNTYTTSLSWPCSTRTSVMKFAGDLREKAMSMNLIKFPCDHHRTLSLLKHAWMILQNKINITCKFPCFLSSALFHPSISASNPSPGNRSIWSVPQLINTYTINFSCIAAGPCSLLLTNNLMCPRHICKVRSTSISISKSRNRTPLSNELCTVGISF